MRGIIAVVIAAIGLATASGAAAQGKPEGAKFLDAVKKRDGTVATQMLSRPGNVLANARDITSGETALHYVVQRRDLTWVRFLLQKGANPDIADRHGVTPLVLAAQIGFIEAVEALLDKGADPDVANVAGETPLISAVHRRDLALVRLLVAKGANPDKTDNSGRTAREYATLMGASGGVLEVIAKAESEKAPAAASYGPR